MSKKYKAPKIKEISYELHKLVSKLIEKDEIYQDGFWDGFEIALSLRPEMFLWLQGMLDDPLQANKALGELFDKYTT